MRSFVKSLLKHLLIICATILTILFILDRILPPSHLWSRLGAEQKLCACHLQGIYKGLKLYAERHQGNFPERLEVEFFLKDFPRMQEKAFICPSRWKSKKAEKYKIGYEYIKGRKLGMPFNTVIVFDKTGNHNYKGYEGKYFGRNVLYVDGTLKWLPEEQFQYVLQQIKADLKAKK